MLIIWVEGVLCFICHQWGACSGTFIISGKHVLIHLSSVGSMVWYIGHNCGEYSGTLTNSGEHALVDWSSLRIMLLILVIIRNNALEHWASVGRMPWYTGDQ